MPRFDYKMEVDATPERAWAVLGDLARVDRWIPGITHVEMQGATERVCTFADDHVQHEHITEYSAERRSYRYSIDGSPGIREHRGSFALVANGRGATVLWEGEFEVTDSAQKAQIGAMWAEAAKTVLDALRQLIERGT